MNELRIFKNEQFGELKALEINDEPWFLGKDIAQILGYSNPHKAIRDHIDDEDKRTERIVHPLGGEQETLFINESGLYSLVLKSNLPKAKPFKRWVTSEVLPTIRKHGAYMVDDVIERTLSDPDYLIQLATTLKEEKAKRQLAEAKILQDKPKVLFADSVETSSDSILIGELAKLISQNGYSIGQNRLFQWLREKGYLIKSGENRNQPTQYSMELGLMGIKKRTIDNPDGSIRTTVTPKVTGKGQIYFINKFLGSGGR